MEKDIKAFLMGGLMTLLFFAIYRRVVPAGIQQTIGA